MRIAQAASLPVGRTRVSRNAVRAASFGVVGGAAILIAARSGTASIPAALGVAAGAGLAVWMFFSERLEKPLVFFLLYLGLLDGFLKLGTNSSVITLGRDALLYAILLGFLARATLRRQKLLVPPLSGWVLAFTAVVLMQLANPADVGGQHTLGALRPHLEFVPLFFVGYALLQTRRRVQTFFVIMLVIATANGIVGAVQLNLTPGQLASWGPGYAHRINGNGTGVSHVSARAYDTTSGVRRTRPFGLGGDSGVGAAWGMLALGAALALVSLRPRKLLTRMVLIVLCLGPPLAIITGEGRAYLVASVVALFAYVLFATTARRLIPTLGGVLLGLLAATAVTAFISSVSGAGVFDRYATITPSKLAATTNENRGASFAAIPKLIVDHPLGNGLGSVGPASSFAGGGNTGSNGETEPGFLVSELGIPGLVVVYGFSFVLLLLGIKYIRRLDPETRSLVAALLAGVVGIVVLGVSSTTTATSPTAPYLWFAGGSLSYWLTVAARKPSLRSEALKTRVRTRIQPELLLPPRPDRMPKPST